MFHQLLPAAAISSKQAAALGILPGSWIINHYWPFTSCSVLVWFGRTSSNPNRSAYRFHQLYKNSKMDNQQKVRLFTLFKAAAMFQILIYARYDKAALQQIQKYECYERIF